MSEHTFWVGLQNVVIKRIMCNITRMAVFILLLQDIFHNIKNQQIKRARNKKHIHVSF